MLRTALKVLRYPGRSLETLRQRYFAPGSGHPDPEIRFMNRWIHGDLPRVEIEDLFPGLEAAQYSLVRGFDRTRNMSITLGEVNVLAALVSHLKCERILEIGTFDGGTTLNLAANLPEGGEVVTVDLPEEAGKMSLDASGFRDNRSKKETVGRQFRGRPEAASIRQVFGDSARVQPEDLGEPFDLVFIDGCHDRVYVESDSVLAEKVVRPGGTIVWHDYGMIRDVTEVLDAYEQEHPGTLHAVAGTRLVIRKMLES